MNAEFRLNGKTIETKRLILRPFVRTDLDDYFEYASVEGTGEMAYRSQPGPLTRTPICSAASPG